MLSDLVLFPAVSSRKLPAQALRWLSITKKCSGILLTRFKGCASEDKANNSLVKSTKPHGAAILTDIYIIHNIYTVWPEILAGNLFWRIGGFESNPPIFHPPKTSQCDVIIIAKS